MLDVTKQIVITVQRLFPELAVYTESMSGGKFEEPSIFVRRISLSVIPLMQSGRQQNYSFELSYFPPPDSQINEELDKMAEVLTASLVTVDGENNDKLARITNREFSIVDDVLHLIFDLTTYSHETIDKLDQSLEINATRNDGKKSN